MKFGSFLLKRFSGAKASRKRPLRTRRRKPLPRTSRFHPLRDLRPPPPRTPPPTVSPEPIKGLVLATQAPQVLPPQEFPEPAPIHEKPDFKKSMESFLLDQRSENTKRAYGKDLKRFMQFLLAKKFAQGPSAKLDRALIIAYKDSLLSAGLEHTSVDRHLATLRSFFRWLVDDGVLAKNPADGVRFLNPKRISKTQGFTDEEVQKVLRMPDLHTRTGSMHYAILMVLFYCGLRRSELCGLRTSSLGDERGHRVLRLRGKGNSERVVVVIPAVDHALKYYFHMIRKDVGRDQFLFSPLKNNRTGDKEKAIDSSLIYYLVVKYAKMAGIANRVSPHSCRATAISNARDHNVPDRAIQEFAGWASPDMITRYDKRKSSVEKSAAHAIQYGAEDRAKTRFDLGLAPSPLIKKGPG